TAHRSRSPTHYRLRKSPSPGRSDRSAGDRIGRSRRPPRDLAHPAPGRLVDGACGWTSPPRSPAPPSMDRLSDRIVRPSLVVALLAAMLAGLSLGTISIGPDRVFRAIVGLHPDILATIAVRYDRAPRVLIGSVSGAMLATSGMLMQAVTRNPL